MKRKNNFGQSIIEYATMIALLLGAVFVIQKYVVRALSGRLYETGEVISQGKVYANKSSDCAFRNLPASADGIWYDFKEFLQTKLDSKGVIVTPESPSYNDPSNVTCIEACNQPKLYGVNLKSEKAENCRFCICSSMTTECSEREVTSKDMISCISGLPF